MDPDRFHRTWIWGCCLGLAFAGTFCASSLVARAGDPVSFAISFPEKIHPQPITGRIYLLISKNGKQEARLQRIPTRILLWGKDVTELPPETSVSIDTTVYGFPLANIGDIPAGEYFVQGFINIYTKFERADGYTLWLHNDRWEGQRWNRSPGNLYSDVTAVTIGRGSQQTVELRCVHEIPPVKIPPDTRWVKRIKFQSKILSRFWGQPIYLGATVLLPRGYDQHPDVYYPVNYIQGHFSLRAPYGFTPKKPEETSRSRNRRDRFSRFWVSDSCPRMIAVTFQHPCPYYDDSYAVNSPNVGPYQDAIMQELIPEVEKRFRIIRQPYARILSGGSTGGWISLMLQLFQPDFFGGVFSLCPDPVDFRYFQCVNIYSDKNAYFKEFGWLSVETPSDRQTDGIVRFTSRQRNHMELVLGSKNRSGAQIDIFEAAFGPIGKDGYVKPLFNKFSGAIDPQVAEYWKQHYDLRYYLKKNWPWLGPKLVGKLHIYVGDMDTYYLNNAVKLLEDFLEQTKEPYYNGKIEYGDGKPHCWGPRSTRLIQLIAAYVRGHAPKGENTRAWHY